MIRYDIDEHQKDQQALGLQELILEGITDGASGFPIQCRFMHNLYYLEAYQRGLEAWIAELKRQEEEKIANSVFDLTEF